MFGMGIKNKKQTNEQLSKIPYFSYKIDQYLV